MEIEQILNTKTVKRFKNGATIWMVMVLEGDAFISRAFVNGRPYLERYGSHMSVFVPISYDCPKSNKISKKYSSFTLKDFNVIPNTYNEHRIFFTEKSARKYADYFNKNSV